MLVDDVADRTATICMPEELDVRCAADLRGQLDAVLRELHAGGPRRLVLDLEQTRFVDCGGWRLCLRVLRDAEAAGVLVELRPGAAGGRFRERAGWGFTRS